MRPIEETNRSLENIEFLLKSIDFQMTKLLNIMTERKENTQCQVDEKTPEVKEKPRLLTTKEASQMFGLSEYELRRGYKEGLYPAIKIGHGGAGKLKWRSDLLEETLRKID